MTKTSYTYCVVRYVHDPAAGEVMNLGVLLYAPSVRYFGFRLETRFKRLSEAFNGFDGDQYRRTLRQLEQSLIKLWDNLSGGLPGMFDMPDDVGQLVSKVWPDQDLSFRFGSTLAGVADEVDTALDEIFQRMVLSQYERPVSDRRSDEDVWADFSKPLPVEIKRVLNEKVIEGEDFKLKFPHAFKNGRWHLLQPVTLDYSQINDIQEKASVWLGRASLLRDSPEVAHLYILLGAPNKEDHINAYLRAKNILSKMPIAHEIIEEDQAADFGRRLFGYMKEHGVIAE